MSRVLGTMLVVDYAKILVGLVDELQELDEISRLNLGPSIQSSSSSIAVRKASSGVGNNDHIL